MNESPTSVPRRRFLRRAAQAAVSAPLLVGGYAWRVEPHWVEVVRRELPIAGLPSALRGRTLALISDLHVGPVVDDAYLRSALVRVLRAEPLAVLVTGDWMTCEGDEQVGKVLRTVEVLRPRKTPIFGILGNHDYGRGFRNNRVATRLSDGLSRIGVTMLRNACVDFHGLQIAGVDDLWSGKCRLRKTLGQIDPGRAALLLAHNPDTLDFRGWDGYRGWVLSGHTHGGQCWAPGLRRRVLPVQNKRYVRGEVGLEDGRRVYINRGLGYKQPIRFLTPPEITLLRLTDKDPVA